MNVPTRLAAFAAVLALVFGGAALAGAAIDPTDDPPSAGTHGASAARGSSSAHGAHGGGAAAGLGLAVDDGAYALAFDRTRLTASRTVPLRLRITDARGRVVRDGFEVEHERELHLIVVRRDTKVFRHLHPRRQPDGTWAVDADLRDPGVYRAYADFRIGGTKRTLAADLFVPGRFDLRPLPAPTATDRAVDEDGSTADGIDVSLTAPTLRAGREARLTYTATRAGRPVDALQPYLGAKGHLVALREGDLAYLHVHPTEASAGTGDAATGHDDTAGAPHDHDAAGNAPQVAAHRTSFEATFPSAGRYRLFLQFRVDGRVRTVDHTVEVAR